jgi:hypothetical protein
VVKKDRNPAYRQAGIELRYSIGTKYARDHRAGILMEAYIVYFMSAESTYWVRELIYYF